MVAGDPELPRLQRGGGRSTLDAAVGQGELALVAATIDGRAHGADDAALMGAHRSEALELARRRLGDHELLLGQDHPAANRDVVGREQACRSEEHTSELQSLMRISYAVFCLKKKKK